MYNDKLIKQFGKEMNIEGDSFYAVKQQYIKWLENKVESEMCEANSNAVLGEVGELVKAQDEYIDFLHEYIGGLAVYLHIHQMSPTKKQIERGKILRDKIQKVRANFV